MATSVFLQHQELPTSLGYNQIKHLKEMPNPHVLTTNMKLNH